MNLVDYMPEALRAPGPWGLAWWQLLALGVVIPLSWMLGRVGAAIAIRLGGRLTGKTATTIDDELILRLAKPIRLLAFIGVARSLVVMLDLPHGASVVVFDALLASLGFALVWGALRVIDVVSSHLGQAAWARARPASRAIVALLSRLGKAIVIAIAGIAVLGALGLPIASLLAGLGIGGIAIAFGAQKTVENLFGAVALGVDQPLREGDFVRVESDVLGTVEAVGLRSTRVRTLDRTVVTLPNGRLADMRIETFAARDRCVLATTIGLVYDTSVAQMREVLAGFERVLREHPGICPDEIVVRFGKFAESSLDVEVRAWFRTTDYSEFRTWRQEVLLGFMDVVDGARTAFAFPTRTIHLANPATLAAIAPRESRT